MKVALKLYQYTPLELIQLTNDLVTAMTGNAAFPTPNPPLSALTAGANAVAEKIDAYEAARVAAAVALSERDAAITALNALLTDEANTVQTISGGDPAIITELAYLNQVYEEKFGFRFVVFVAGRSRAELLPILRERLERTWEEELETGMRELVAIARDRWQQR